VVGIRGFKAEVGRACFSGRLVAVESMNRPFGRSSVEILEVVVKYSNQEFEKQVNETLMSMFHLAAKSSIP